MFVDCTGEGHLSARAGAPYEQVPKDELRPHTLSFTVDGVDWGKVLEYVKKNVGYDFNNPMVNSYLGWTKEQIIERFQKIQSPVEIRNFMGFFSIRDEALAKGDWHR